MKMILQLGILTCVVMVFHQAILAQERQQIPVMIDGKELVMDWNGGFNAPQFSNIDLNRDGVQDLISFDRQGNVLRTYIRLPASGRWILDWSFVSVFPPLVDWVLIADYDMDGVEDIFTSSSPTGVAGISVYKGSYENGIWNFTLVPDRGRDYLQVSAGSSGLTNLYASWEDIPAITDIDGDGDLDILSFEPGGSFISYFANQSVESGWGTDSLRFKLQDICWGKILENELNESVYLSDDQNMCSDGNIAGEEEILPRHSGSSILALDIDYDGDKDVWLGDISSSTLVFLTNGLNAQNAWITEQEPSFPSQDTVIELPYFVAAYSVQLDDDPEPELLAAVNSRSLSEDKMSVWRYDDDIFTDGPLDYKLEEKGFFQNEMIDIGSHSRPAVADVNGDGLPDIVMGGYRYSQGELTRVPSLWYFQNRGTPTQPYFELMDEDFLNMAQYADLPTFEFAPAFGDIDRNGSVDLLVGDQNGKLFFFNNIAQPGQAMSFATVVYPYMNINVGVAATPQIVDINGDGLNDLVIGERTGNADNMGRCSNLNYFENVGQSGNAMFGTDVTAAPNTQCFGRVLFDIEIGLPQYSTPSIVRTPDGLMMLTGNDLGNLVLYGDVENGKTGALSLIDAKYNAIDVGNRSAPVLADLNNDGVYDLIVGNQRGGLELFVSDLIVGYTSIDPIAKGIEKPYHLYGSLNGGVVDISWKEPAKSTILVFNALGQILELTNHQQEAFTRIDLSGQISGVYFLQISSRGYQWVEKVIRG